MDMQSLKSVVKEKLVKIMISLRALFMGAKNKIMLWPRKKKIIILAVLVLAVGAVVLLTAKPFSKSNPKTAADRIKAEESNILFKGKTNVTAKMGDSVNLGNLKVDFYNIKESSYLSFDKDSNQNRITVRYLAAQISVQNISGDKTENILIGLKDDKGNNYRLDFAVPFYVDDTRDFGRNMMMFPRTITDGYVFFSNVAEDAKNLELIVALSPSKEKAAFKFERKGN